MSWPAKDILLETGGTLAFPTAKPADMTEAEFREACVADQFGADVVIAWRKALIEALKDGSPAGATRVKFLTDSLYNGRIVVLRAIYKHSRLQSAAQSAPQKSSAVRRGRRKGDGELKMDRAPVAFIIELIEKEEAGLSEAARIALKKFPDCQTTSPEATLARFRFKARKDLRNRTASKKRSP